MFIYRARILAQHDFDLLVYRKYHRSYDNALAQGELRLAELQAAEQSEFPSSFDLTIVKMELFE